MFFGLWHRAVISGNDEDRIVNAANAREHIAHEAFVSGHIDKSAYGTIAEVGISEPEID